MTITNYSDTQLAKLIEDDRVAREVLNRLSGLRAEAQRVPDVDVGEDQAVRRAAPELLAACKGVVEVYPCVDAVHGEDALYDAVRDVEKAINKAEDKA